MHMITAGIVVAVAVPFVFHWLADMMNLSAVSAEIPAEFAGFYDDEAYAASQQYLRITTWMDRLAETVETGVFLVFWFARGFAWLDQWVRSLGVSPVISGIVFIGLLAAGRGLLHLPFSIYATFGVEARFGFNRTTPRLFIADRIKAILVGICLGGPLLAGILAFFTYAGNLAWLWCWIMASLFLLIMQVVVPTWIMPLFNRFTPPADPSLKEALFDYARRNRFPLASVFVMDGSRRSTKSNAFFAGWGKRKRLVLFDTMLELLAIPEVVAVVAHEVGHYRKKHLMIGMFLAFLQLGIIFYLLSLVLSCRPVFEAFYVDRISVYAGLVFFGVLYGPLDFLLGLVLQMVSRRQEYAADRFAVATTGDPESFIRALKRLSVENLSHLTPHPFYVWLHYAHPPMIQRIREIRDRRENLRQAEADYA